MMMMMMIDDSADSDSESDFESESAAGYRKRVAADDLFFSPSTAPPSVGT